MLSTASIHISFRVVSRYEMRSLAVLVISSGDVASWCFLLRIFELFVPSRDKTFSVASRDIFLECLIDVILGWYW